MLDLAAPAKREREEHQRGGAECQPDDASERRGVSNWRSDSGEQDRIDVPGHDCRLGCDEQEFREAPEGADACFAQHTKEHEVERQKSGHERGVDRTPGPAFQSGNGQRDGERRR